MEALEAGGPGNLASAVLAGTSRETLQQVIRTVGQAIREARRTYLRNPYSTYALIELISTFRLAPGYNLLLELLSSRSEIRALQQLNMAWEAEYESLAKLPNLAALALRVLIDHFSENVAQSPPGSRAFSNLLASLLYDNDQAADLRALAAVHLIASGKTNISDPVIEEVIRADDSVLSRLLALASSLGTPGDRQDLLNELHGICERCELVEDFDRIALAYGLFNIRDPNAEAALIALEQFAPDDRRGSEAFGRSVEDGIQELEAMIGVK